MTSDNRDPMDWVLYGSNDWGQTWTQLDSRTGETFSDDPQTKVYTIQNPGAYSTYELQIEKTANGSSSRHRRLGQPRRVRTSG